MKKLLALTKPLPISVLSLLIVSVFLRYYLAINSDQMLREFKNQNFREIYSMDTLKLASRMNALSSVINWVCMEGSVDGRSFYKMERGECETGIFQHRKKLLVPEANNIKLEFTIRLPKEVEQLFLLFLGLQTILIFALITSTRRNEEEKRENEIRINKLARQMSHDIRSPLATFNTILDNIKTIPKEDMDLLRKSANRIHSIADSLLDSSRYFSPEETASETNVNSIVEEIVAEKMQEFGSLPNLKISFSESTNDFAIKLSSTDFRRILSNLINNAIDARGNGAIEIKIKTIEELGRNIIQIRDNGKGISADILEKLGNEEFTTKAGGNGIGLKHCKEMVTRSNGELTIQSEINKGTVINLAFPATKTVSEENVLIDDDELVRLTWTSSAKKKNIRLMTARSLDEIAGKLQHFSKQTNFYIDSDLGNDLKGEDIASELSSKGFENIYMASGYHDEHFKHLTFLKGVIGKTPPWK